jgi:hypothetical protein
MTTENAEQAAERRNQQLDGITRVLQPCACLPK